jgi:hypothetical protein
MTREEWLQQLVEALHPLFDDVGEQIPSNVRIACGWPSRGGTARVKRVVGQCWPELSSADGSMEIFISPWLADPVDVAGVVVHELVHAVLRCEYGHRGPFKRIAVGLGLEGKMPATTVGPQLSGRLSDAILEIGPYPHAQLETQMHTVQRIPLIPGEGMKKQSTRLMRLECPNQDCKFVIWTTRKWIYRYPVLPICPCGSRFIASI